MTRDEAQVRMYVLTEHYHALNDTARNIDREVRGVLDERRELIAAFPTLDICRLKPAKKDSLDINAVLNLNAGGHRLGVALNQCGKAPEGWRCSRENGHTGPCAAWPVEEGQ
jgi:hypothetical protein